MGVISTFAKFCRQLCSVTSSPFPFLFLRSISSTPSSSPLLHLLVFSPQHLWIYFVSSLTGHRNRRGTATAGHRNRRGTATDGAPRPTGHRDRRAPQPTGHRDRRGTATAGHRDRRASRPPGIATDGDCRGPSWTKVISIRWMVIDNNDTPSSSPPLNSLFSKWIISISLSPLFFIADSYYATRDKFLLFP